MALGTERTAVQNPFLRYAREVGWKYLPPDEATRLRRGETELVLHEVLVRQHQALNPGVVDLQRAEDIVGRLVRVRPNIEGNLEAWDLTLTVGFKKMPIWRGFERFRAKSSSLQSGERLFGRNVGWDFDRQAYTFSQEKP